MNPEMPADAGRDAAVVGDIATELTDTQRPDGSPQESEGALPKTLRASDSDWVPLAVAAEELGVSISALRKAFRSGRIVSRIGQGRHGPQRTVRLSEVSEVVGVRRRKEPQSPSDSVARDIGRGPLEVADGENDLAHITKADWDAVIEELASLRAAVQQVLEEDSLVGEVLLEHLREHDKVAAVEDVDAPASSRTPGPPAVEGRPAARGRHRRFGLSL